MRRLDVFGMVLMIIGVNFIGIAFFIFIGFPRPTEVFPRLYTSFRVFIGVLLIIGALTFIIGSTIRLIVYFQKKRPSTSLGKIDKNNELEIIDDIIDYLKNNTGKAFTIDALLNKVSEENQIQIRQSIIEELLQEFVIRNVIKAQFKDGEKFYFY